LEIYVVKTLLVLVRGDITQQDTEAVVNAANSSLMGGGGVDGAIHRAGGPKILEECKQIVARQGRLPAGEAVITTGGNLKARYVIHTVGPVWRGGNSGEDELLRSSCLTSLSLAWEKGISTISFPSVSTGAYGFPIKRAARIALSTVFDFCQNHLVKEIRFVLFSEQDLKIYEDVLRCLV